MALSKLYDVYTLDTSCFFTDYERILEKKLNKAKKHLYSIEKRYEDKEKEYEDHLYEKHIRLINYIIKIRKKNLKSELSKNEELMREVIPDRLIDKNVVSIFDSHLTRSLGMNVNQLNQELIIIKVYYFSVAKSIVNNGFMMNGDKYVFFSASAGQIRTKKFVAVKENLLTECWNTLTCGLTLERINEFGGVNRNKYLAYLSLVSSATDVIDFDIDKCIVVNDFETLVNGEVDYIDNNTFEITRKFMDVPITHTDGVGLINYGDKNFMCRAPWIKGLLSPFRFHNFIREYCPSGDCTVKDIWGKEHNIIRDDIQVIFSKSQMKMWKYYNNWEHYKENYKKYNCTFGICNEEEDYFKDTTLNYQMLQTLTDVTDEELQYICKPTRNKIRRLSSDIPTMLKVFGVTKYNTNKNAFQKCLEVYPELLQEVYTRDTLRAIKIKLEKEAWAGKLDVYGKYTFIIPDLFAFCEYLFLGIEYPNGILKDGEVYCRLFKSSEKIDCLRSPHLERSHGVRKNVVKSYDERFKWLITNGVYTSCYDLISKLLQFDCDGDRALVVGDRKFVEIAERNMIDTVPLYYEMGKAAPQIIDNKILYEGMVLAYTTGNIGPPSNDISKGWDSDDIDLDAIKIQAAMVNYTIDNAKTLYKPELPKSIQNRIKKHTKKKLPHFFIYAKDKDENNVELINSCTVNRIRKFIPKSNIKFSTSSLSKFNYKILMRNKDIVRNELYYEIVKKYREISKNVNIFINIDDDKNNYNHLYRSIINEMETICSDKYLLVDVLVDNLFNIKKSKHKSVFWSCYGDIVFENLEMNMVDNYIYCTKCGKRFFREHYNENTCNECKGYKAIEKKIVLCVDCKKEFEVQGSVKNKKRCNECYGEYRKIQESERKGQKRKSI